MFTATALTEPTVSQTKRKNANLSDNDSKKKTLTLEEEQEVVDHLIVKLKSDLVHFDKDLNDLKYNFVNFENLIYEECSELKRLVQLNTEEAIAFIKRVNHIHINCETYESNVIEQQINSLNEANQKMIENIDKYEKLSKSSMNKLTQSKRTKLGQEINKLKLISKHFITYWSQLIEINNPESSKLTKAAAKLNEYQSRLDSVVDQLKQSIFSNNGILKFIPMENDKLGYLYLNQSINFSHLNRYSLFKLFIDSDVFDVSDLQFELFESNYLVSFRKRGKNNTFIYVFNTATNTIVKKVILDNHRIHNLKRIEKLIVMISSSDYFYNREIVIMDDTLTVVRRKNVGSLSLVGANSKYLYCFEDININGRCNACKVFDWSLESVTDLDINFQQTNSSLPFYIPFETLHISIWQLESLNNKYIVRSISDCTLQPFVIIYDAKGRLIRLVNVTKLSDGLFRLDSPKSQVIVHDSGKLMYFDLSSVDDDCLPVKEIELISKEKFFKLENVFNFQPDNDRFHFFHESFIFN